MGLSLADHTAKYFPIDATAIHALNKDTPDGPLACESCHASQSVTQVTCIGCHKHPTEPINGREVNDTLHLGAPDYLTKVPAAADVPTKSVGCIECHHDGKRLLSHFPHDGIAPGQGSFCIMCHDKNAAFDAFEVKLKLTPDFKHVATGGGDCGGCHKTDTWKGAVGVPNTVFDPTKSVTINALIPRYAGTSMSSVTPNTETINMSMNHGATAVDAGVLGTCSNCHAEANTGVYYPGLMHSSLANLGVPQPARCNECHGLSIPTGFVGALMPSRSPQTGEMMHDAVVWSNNVRTATRVVTQDCGVCHQAPNELVDAKWKFSNGKPDAGAEFHDALALVDAGQPASCLDCHANSRPIGPAGAILFDHQVSGAMGNCADCHRSFKAWAGGQFHAEGAVAPASCLPCHEATRPISTATWMGSFTVSPFDYVVNPSNPASDSHGGAQDCVVCHAGPGSGAWGVNQNWQRGSFTHAPTTIAANTCISCHTTQRPDVLTSPTVPASAIGFDHALSGTGDCIGCHGATVSRGSYVTLRPFPGDWRDGGTYPGSALITAPNQFVRVASTSLTRSGQNVTGMLTTTVTLPNAMLHTSAAIPAAVFPGDAGTPDMTTCWHCHTSTGTNVTAFSNGKFHSALTAYSATPGGLATPLSMPASARCTDCHSGMRPPNIVSKTDAGTWLLPMDHSATFTGGTVTGVAAMDCHACHNMPGLNNPTQWSDGKFHPNLPAGAAPSDCVSCHYPLMTTAQADVASPAPAGTNFSMKHRSGLVTTQACATCHTQALGRATNAPTAAALWATGEYHSKLTATTQPATCLDCHTTSEPTAATQGTVTYALPAGGTATNGAQWMNHTDSTVTGKDCASCHLADARVTGSAWNRAAAYHPVVPTVVLCAKCHGTTNGKGTVIGTNNNLPNGLTTTDTLSSVDGGLKDQVTHADVNVTAYDCSVCHTQKGASTVAGVQGKEWKQANFHVNFGAARVLLMNSTTGRCSNCHLNVKPAGIAGGQDHATFSATSGSQDCSSCHSYPGTGTPAAPNWKGAAGFPTYISVGGFTIPVPPATTAGTTQTGISNLPHPTVAAGVQCTTCHPATNPTHKRAAGYDHVSTLISTNCNSCHEAGSDLVAVAWSSTTHGDTRAQTALTIKGKVCSPTHFFPTDCKECHVKPAGNGTWTTGTNAMNQWYAPHTNGGNNRGPMTNPATCNKCHGSVASGGCGIPK
jgi:hypothetical protein